MKETVLELFEQYPQLAVVISLLLSVLVAILGLIPSVFITAANILFFGFWPGTLISFAGEALGAAISFWLYRKGFKKRTASTLRGYPKLKQLLSAKGREAFWLILSFRLIPFIPSGLVTFAAAVGQVSAGIFITASSLGKIPALLMEAWSVYQVTRFQWQGKLVLAIVALVILYLVWKQIRLKNNSS
ncbi:MAG: TVP38/TMEM64 family protein, partial [Flavisolibacter sp.]